MCHIYATAKQENLLDLAKRANDSFLSKGFKIWKKRMKKFDAHERSNTHRLALSNNLQKKKGDSVLVQINCSFFLQQKQARTALIKIISSLRYLAGQGLAIQGRNSDDGNFNELLTFREKDIAGLHSWLARKHSYTSYPIQNDILRIMCHMVLRKIRKEVNDQSINFGIVVNGTQDIQRKELQCICVRYVTDTFQIKEEFLGLYNIEQWFSTFLVERNPNETFQMLEEPLCNNLISYAKNIILLIK